MRKNVIALSIAAALLLLGAGCKEELAADLNSVNGSGSQAKSDASRGPAGDAGEVPPGSPEMRRADMLNNEPKSDADASPDKSTCESKKGTSMTLGEAKSLGRAGDCGKSGTIDPKSGGSCNLETGTWWMDLAVSQPKSGCNPACVVTLDTKKAEVNWRCTGAKVP